MREFRFEIIFVRPQNIFEVELHFLYSYIKWYFHLEIIYYLNLFRQDYEFIYNIQLQIIFLHAVVINNYQRYYDESCIILFITYFPIKSSVVNSIRIRVIFQGSERGNFKWLFAPHIIYITLAILQLFFSTTIFFCSTSRSINRKTFAFWYFASNDAMNFNERGPYIFYI